jgi:hypothetical protein
MRRWFIIEDGENEEMDWPFFGTFSYVGILFEG